MMILFLIITAALTIYAAFNIIAPFFQSREEQLRFEVLDEDLRTIEDLVARRSYLLKSLRELQLDHETGKIPDDDFEDTRKKLEYEAVKVLRELDEVHGGRGWQDAIDAELDARLDGIRERRGIAADQSLREKREPEAPKDQSVANDETGDSESDVLIDCPECGKDMEAEARFCSRCGFSFVEEAQDVESADSANDPDDDPGDDASVDAASLTDPQKDLSDTSTEVAR